MADIPEFFKPGMELLVQVVKSPIGTKGARVTTNMSIPGRYLVLMPYSEHIGLSTRIEGGQERDRLRKILASLELPEGMGLICRTVGEGRKATFFKRDLELLLDYWRKIETAMETKKAPFEVFAEPNLVERTIRDFMTEEIGGIVVDDKAACKQITDTLKRIGGAKMAEKVTFYNSPKPIFDHYRINDQLREVYQREVRLPGGGCICIDETEALIAIDVNSGRGRKGTDQPEFILKTNLEAAAEIARQLRLRNIGGLVRGNIVRHVGDDFMNIHSYVFPAVKAEGKTLYVKAKDWNLRNFAPGRRLGLLRTSAGQNGIAKEVRITAIEPEGELLKVTLDGGFGRIVTLEDTKGMPDMLILPDNQNHGMVVTGNRFEDGVSRFLAGGRNWLFTDNTVVDSLHHSYFMNLCPETVGRNGFEFVTPRNVELAGNRFETAAKTLFRFGSSANAEREADHSIPSASHIRVADNDIEITGSSNLPLIRINGVEFLTFTGNRISAAAPQGGPLFEREGGRELELGGNFVTGNLKR